jgi:hypothetical protein
MPYWKPGNLPKFVILIHEEDGLYYEFKEGGKAYTPDDLKKLEKELEEHHPQSKLIVITAPNVND